jgi:multiple sugar transport system ATP-binding protein
VTASVLELLGTEVNVIFSVDAPPVETEELRAAGDGEGKLLLDDDKARFTGKLDPRTRVRHGEKIRLTVDTSRCHFFDADTGASLAASAATASAPA